MKIHEYQGRDLLASYGIPVPAGQVIESPLAAEDAFHKVCKAAGMNPGTPTLRVGSETDAMRSMAVPLVVIKAQVHAGGRGKAGFVKLVRTAEEAKKAAQFMLSNRMVSPQTGPEGLEVKKLLVAAGVEIANRKGSGQSAVGSGGKEEFYLAITMDRTSRRNVLIASREGGVEIETVAHERPEAIIKQPLHPTLGLQAFAARKVAYQLGLSGKLASQAADVMMRLAKLFVEKDCSLAEINPLVVAVGGSGQLAVGSGGAAGSANAHSPLPTDLRIMAIDAKFSFDDNGLFRHPELESMADPAEENPAELRAKAAGLSYIALDGNIGCLVNGAGLAMATMDIIKLHGGTPANFLDVGGGASEEAVTEAFKIILSDKHVKGILVNIFGGIMRCDIIAQGVVNAAKTYQNPDGSTGFKVPLVVRLEGTNVEEGRRILSEAKSLVPTLQAATDLADAAKKVCGAVGGVNRPTI